MYMVSVKVPYCRESRDISRIVLKAMNALFDLLATPSLAGLADYTKKIC